MKWYEIHGNVQLLYRYLWQELDFDRGQLLAVISEPWKWEKEFNDARRWASQAA